MKIDYTAMVKDFVIPSVVLFVFVFGLLGWILAFRLSKEVTDLRIRLGKEDRTENAKISFGFIWAAILSKVGIIHIAVREQTDILAVVIIERISDSRETLKKWAEQAYDSYRVVAKLVRIDI
jgi:hypothetical protein